MLQESTVERHEKIFVNLTEKPINILHIDDEPSLLKVAKSCLEMEGAFQVETAPSVEEALKKMETKTYDAIVSDYVMPGKDGLEFLKELRDAGDDIPFIIFTGKGREEVAKKALNLGADQYLNKTGDPQTVYYELAYSIRQAVDRKNRDEMLKESEERFRNLYECIPDALSVYVGREGHLLDYNEAFKKQYGYTDEELKHKTFLDFVHPDDHAMVLEKYRTSYPEEDLPLIYEITAVNKKGEIIPIEISVSTYKKKGKVIGIEVLHRDVAERKRAEHQLLESEEKFRKLAEQSPNMIFINKKGRVVYTNKKSEEIMGYTRHEMYSPDFEFYTLIAPECMNLVKSNFKKHMKNREIPPYEYTLITKEGERIAAILTSKLIKYEGETAILGIVTNITERKKMETEIRENQEKFQKLFAHNPEAAVYVNQNYKIVDINPRFTNLFGYPLNEIKGKGIDELVVPTDRMEEGKMLSQKASEGYVYYDTIRKKKDGSLVEVSISAAPITAKNQLIGHVAMYRDITAQKRTEKELEEARRHFQTLFNLMVDPVAIVDKKGKILEVTQKAEEVTGFKREELLGKNFLRTKIATAKSKAIMMKSLAKRMMGMAIEPYEVEMLTKDGRRLPYEVNAAKIEYKGKPADLVVFRDISERKKMEEKLHVVGRLTRHDVQNKLSVVTGNVYLAKHKIPMGSEAIEYLENVESACQQVQRIFDFARTYEKLGMEKLVYVDVGKIIDESKTLCLDLHSVEVVNNCYRLTVLADSLLRQVFYNLIDNSLRHGEKVSRIKFYYEDKRDHMRLIYEDDGIGIPSSEKELIFQEGHGKYTGYGLHLMRRICEVYGWTIQETGKQYNGANFIMIIPKNDGKKELYRV